MSNVLTTVRKGRFLLVAAIASALVLVVAACGSSGSDPSSNSSSASASQLLEQTFHGKHSVKSGKLGVVLTIVPKGSTVLTRPISLSVTGPFQSAGKGNLPESDFTVNLSAQGEKIGLSVISAGGHGYISTGGSSFQLPASDYKELESGFSSITGTASGTSSAAASKSKIDPLSWLTDATIVGNSTVAGTPTTQIHATVDTSTMLDEVSKLLKNSSALKGGDGAELSSLLSPAKLAGFSKALGKPDFNVWTGTSDHTVRKLTVTATVPVSGSASSELGGLKSARVVLAFTYGDLNQPQTITAPTNLKPYTEFKDEVQTLLGTIGSAVIAKAEGGGTSTTGSASGADAKYSACITNAGGDVAKIQKCASLLH